MIKDLFCMSKSNIFEEILVTNDSFLLYICILTLYSARIFISKLEKISIQVRSFGVHEDDLFEVQNKENIKNNLISH